MFVRSVIEKPKNHLLAALPQEDYQHLAPDLETVMLSHGQVIHSADEPIEYVYFPHESIISIVSITADGSTVEVGLVGREGMAGVQVILGGDTSPYEALAQGPGEATRIKADRVIAEFKRGGTLQSLLLRYVQAFLVQVSQTAVCNRLHSIEIRLARWLLLVQDRVESDELLLTQEFIAQMLGVRRAGVTSAATALQHAGLIQYRRGKIRVLNRADLEASACECYQTVRDEFERLLGFSVVYQAL